MYKCLKTAYLCKDPYLQIVKKKLKSLFFPALVKLILMNNLLLTLNDFIVIWCKSVAQAVHTLQQRNTYQCQLTIISYLYWEIRYINFKHDLIKKAIIISQTLEFRFGPSAQP